MPDLFTPTNQAILGKPSPVQQQAWAPIYNPMTNPNTNANIAVADTRTQRNQTPPQATTRNRRQFGLLDWDVINATNTGLGLLQGIANRSGNSSQNAVLDFNNQQFNPLNYLPSNPNFSQQAYYGQQYMASGGLFADDDEADFLFEETETRKAPEEVTPDIVEAATPQVQERPRISDFTPVTYEPYKRSTNLYKHVQDAFDEDNGAMTTDTLFSLTNNKAYKGINTNVAKAAQQILAKFPDLQLTSGKRSWGDKDAHPIGRAVDISGNPKSLTAAMEYYKSLVPQYGFNKALPLNHGTGAHIHVGYYEDGGETGGDTLYVNNKRDPRLIAYQDSLASYNWTRNRLNEINRTGLNGPGGDPVTRKPTQKVSRSQEVDRRYNEMREFLPNITKKDISIQMNQGDIINRGTGKLNSAESFYVFDITNGVGDHHSLAGYAKPKLPVVYREGFKYRPDMNIVDSTDPSAQALTTPTNLTRGPQDLMALHAGSPVYGPSNSLIGNYTNEGFYPVRDYDRYNVKTADRQFLQNKDALQNYIDTKAMRPTTIFDQGGYYTINQLMNTLQPDELDSSNMLGDEFKNGGIVYNQGGIYDVSPAEIKRLKSLGYTIDFV